MTVLKKMLVCLVFLIFFHSYGFELLIQLPFIFFLML